MYRKINDTVTTVMVDDKGNIIREFLGGRFRGAYKRSMIKVGERILLALDGKCGQILATNYFTNMVNFDENSLMNTGEIYIYDKTGERIVLFNNLEIMGIHSGGMITRGEYGYGLYYDDTNEIGRDIKKIGSPKVLTSHYVYDAKFLSDGRIVYIIDDEENQGENNYVLCISDREGNLIKEKKLSGEKININLGEKNDLSKNYIYELDLGATNKKAYVIENNKSTSNHYILYLSEREGSRFQVLKGDIQIVKGRFVTDKEAVIEKNQENIQRI